MMAGGDVFPGIVMPKLRLIAVALLAASGVMSLALTARAVPLEPDECQTLKAAQRELLTPELKAALAGGPDWVKNHLHNQEEIEKIREFLSVEEKIKFRCRTDGVVMPKPKIVPLPDRKPPVPTYISLLPLRKPVMTEAAPVNVEVAEEDVVVAEEVPGEDGAGDADPEAGPSQTLGVSDKTTSPN
jgi:hypothetical protein